MGRGSRSAAGVGPGRGPPTTETAPNASEGRTTGLQGCDERDTGLRCRREKNRTLAEPHAAVGVPEVEHLLCRPLGKRGCHRAHQERPDESAEGGPFLHHPERFNGDTRRTDNGVSIALACFFLVHPRNRKKGVAAIRRDAAGSRASFGVFRGGRASPMETRFVRETRSCNGPGLCGVPELCIWQKCGYSGSRIRREQVRLPVKMPM